jgi:hypothetical protein
MSQESHQVKKLIGPLKPQREELSAKMHLAKMHLAGMELRDEWDRLDRKLS